MPSYDAFAFRQVAHGPLQLAFIATSADIDCWAKVPTKMSRKPAAFQRPALETHVSEVRSFFQDPSKANSSPTAIILGLEPEAAASCRVLQSKNGPPLSDANVTVVPQRCWVEIDFEPWSSASYANEVSREVADLFDAVKSIYPAEDPSQPPGLPEPEHTLIVDDADDAPDAEGDQDLVSEEEELLDSVEEHDTEGQSEAGASRRGRKPSPEKLENARIKAYFDQLSPEELARICRTREYESWSQKQQLFLRDLLKDDRKPGLIIDGQHRVKGTAQHAKVPFLVSFLPGAPWAELAFQFIVNNGSAKKVGEGLLISIVGDSLTPAELRTIEERLYRAKIKVSLIQAVMRVQEGDNPFSGMLEFNVPGELGFLEAPAMQKKVVRLWYGGRDQSGNSGRFARLRVKDRNDLSMKDMFAGSCNGPNIKERVKDWQDQHKWFAYFGTFWRAVANHFQPRLWPPTAQDWPRKSRRAKPVDKERLKLMRVTVLGILQEAILVAWSTDVIKERKRKAKKLHMGDFKISPTEFEEAIAGYVRQIPTDFFTEITYSGFDGSPSLRDDLRNQMLHLLENRKEFADIRATHKFWKYTR